MKNIFNKIVGVVAVFSIMLSTLTFTAAAASKSNIALTKKTLTVGEALTATVTIDGGEGMGGTFANLYYNSDILKFVSGEQCTSGTAGVARIVGTPGGASKQSYAINFTAIAAGNCSISLQDVSFINMGTDINASEISVGGAAVSVSVVNPTLSDNANLSSLKLSKGTLSPRFSAATVNYTASVPYSVTKVSIYATAKDGGAKVALGANGALIVGANARTVTVTAPSGAQKVYTITITRLTEAESASLDQAASSDPEGTGDQPGDLLAVEVGGEPYRITQDIGALTVPTGFTATTATYNGLDIGVASSEGGEYTLYYLSKEGDTKTDYYTYDKSTKKFNLLPYVTLSGTMYIFADEKDDINLPDGYHTTSINLGNSSVTSYCSDSDHLSDFYIIYCFVNGKYRYYSYDYVEGTMQRVPNFGQAAGASVTPGKLPGLISAFVNLGGTGKAIVVSLIVAAGCIISLMVLLILRFFGYRRMAAEGANEASYFDEDFETTNLDFITDETGKAQTPEFSEVTVVDTNAPAEQEVTTEFYETKQ